jgi:hypothetical protein
MEDFRIHHDKYAYKFFEGIFVKQTYMHKPKRYTIKGKYMMKCSFFFQFVMYMVWNILSTRGPIYKIHA